MRVGFYLSGNTPVERVLPLLARAARRARENMLVVARDTGFLERIDTALWEECASDFLAHGYADQPHAQRQPVLLGQDCNAANGARMIALADGEWREEAATFDRVFLMFDDGGRAAARTIWSQFDGRDDVERKFHVLENGRWVSKG